MIFCQGLGLGVPVELKKEGPKSIIAVLAAAFFVVNANILLVPALLPFISADLKLSPVVRGALVVALPLASFAGNVVFGPLIDTVGRRRSLLLGTGGMAILLVSTALCASGLAAVMLRCATGLVMPLAGISVFPCIAQYLPLDRRVAATGHVMAGGSLAQMITTPLAVVVAGHLSWRSGFVALSAISAAAFAGAVFWLPSTRATQRRQPDGISRLRRLVPPASKGVRGTIAAFLIFVFSAFCVTALYPTWLISTLGRGANGSRADVVGLLFLLGGGVAVTGASLTGYVARRAGPGRVPLVLAAPAALVVALPLFPRTYVAQLLAWALFAGIESLTLPLLRGRTNLLVSDGQISTVNASLNAGYQIAAATAGAVSAALYGIGSSFWLNSTVAAIGFLAAAATFASTAQSRIGRKERGR